MGEYNGVIGGVSSIVTDGWKPWWHSYEGTVQADLVEDHELTIDEAYNSALNWQVGLHDVYVNIGDDETPCYVLFDGKKATVKEDDGRPLGIVSETFGVTQNEVLKELGEALKAHAQVYCESAGTLFDFRQAWMLLKLGEDKYFQGLDEKLERYLLVATGHDGTLALSARPTSVRVECMNTMDFAMRGTKSLVTLRHTTNVEKRIEAAKKIISDAYDHFNAVDEEIERLLAMEYTRTQYQDKLVPALVGAKPEEEGRALTMWEKKRDGLVASYERPDQRNIAGTGWGAVMAVNSYENWGVAVRGQTRAEMQARKALKGDWPLTEQARELLSVN